MIDSKFIINNLEDSIRKLQKKSVPKEDIEQLHQLILEKNKLIKQAEDFRSQRNKLSKEIGSLMAQKPAQQKEQKQKVDFLKTKVSEIKNQMEKQEKELEQKQATIKDRLLNIPNFPDDKAPEGKGSQHNKVIAVENYNPEKQTPPHWDIMEPLNIFDQARAGKITGSMFAILKGSGAKLLRELIHFAYDIFHEDYLELIVPSVVNSETFTGTGHLPKFAEEAYHIEKDNLWLIPTGEVPLTALHANEILFEKDLTLKYMTHTSCFRREAGAAGQETRGLQRLHEFHKVELVKICKPEDSEKELQSLLKDALKPIQLLKLPYRILDLCTGDLTFASARTFDIEVYSPGTKQWLEVSSVGLFTDYQSRRSNIRYRNESQELNFVHTLNGSGLATPRVFAAILENYFQKDGRVEIPEALQDLMKKKFLN